MNNTLRTALIVLVVLALAGGLFFAGVVFGRQRSPADFSYWGMPMMGGGARRGGPQGFDPGGGGWGTGGYGRGPMMERGQGYGPGYAGTAQPLTLEESRQAAQDYLKELGLEDLEVGEVMIFDNNAYVVVNETSTGIGAFELLIDPIAKAAYPEPGANVMWNLKYGSINHARMMDGRGMGWMMGGYPQNLDATPATVAAEMPLSEERASESGQTYLDEFLPDHTLAGHATTFYGYYTFDFEKDGSVAGMLSVNGYNGDVFLHVWHGTFIEESE